MMHDIYMPNFFYEKEIKRYEIVIYKWAKRENHDRGNKTND